MNAPLDLVRTVNLVSTLLDLIIVDLMIPMNELSMKIKTNNFSVKSFFHRKNKFDCIYGGYGEMAQKVIEGDMSHVKSYA